MSKEKQFENKTVENEKPNLTPEQIKKFKNFKVPGVTRRGWPDKNGNQCYSYELIFQRGSNDNFVLELVAVQERDKKGRLVSDGKAYRNLDDMYGDDVISIRPVQVYLDSEDKEIPFDKEKIQKLGVRLNSVKSVMSLDDDAKAYLVPKTKEGRLALEEFFKARKKIEDIQSQIKDMK